MKKKMIIAVQMNKDLVQPQSIFQDETMKTKFRSI